MVEHTAASDRARPLNYKAFLGVHGGNIDVFFPNPLSGRRDSLTIEQ
jgi:hypothetical protein